MTFLNGALVWGAAAFSIPLIIHILNRSRFRTIEWGAMHLLEAVIKVNHRRFRIEQLILLLIRCAIPILLAICLARPVLTGSNPLEGDAPVSLVVLLDTSYSMDTRDQNGTRFDEAAQAARELIQATGRQSEISVILTGGKPTHLFDQPVFDSAAVDRRLGQQQAGLGASDMQAALDEGLSTISQMSNARRELVVVSDFQRADWATLANDDTIRQRVSAMTLPTTITLLPVGRSASGNVSVDALEFPQRALGANQRLDIRATIRNHGAERLDQVRVVLGVDGDDVEVSDVSIEPESTTQVLFPFTFSTPGSHTLEVRVALDDPLAADNRFAAAVTVWDKIRVLLVDGDVRSQPLESETDFLAVALTPYTFGRVRLADLVETQTVRPQDVTEELLQSFRVVVLANVARLDDAQLAALTAFVEQGGGLMVTAGDRIDLNWYRERFYAAGSGLLPAAFDSMAGEEAPAARKARIVAQHYEHPALAFFNTPANGDLSQAEIRRWYQVDASRDTPEEMIDQPAPVVLARLDTGDPLLVERRYGEGVVLQCATACDADWSDLPMRPVYVPLMQQLVTSMASGLVPPRNIETGEPAVMLLSDVEPGTTIPVRTPDGSRQTVHTSTLGNRELARFEGTQRPGIYTMSLPSAEPVHFAAEAARSESELSTLDEPQIADLSEALGATVVGSAAEYIEQDRLRRNGREVWKYVLMTLLGLMFLELVLQQRFARVRR